MQSIEALKADKATLEKKQAELTKQLFDLKVKIKQIDKALKVLDPQETTTETPGTKD
jgi:prefoldin subunit 5